MRVKSYAIGQVVRLTARFTVEDVLTDPTTVTMKIKHPDDTVDTFVYGTDAEVVKESAGVFHVDVATDAHGNWYYRAESTGVAPGAGEDMFEIKRGSFQS